MPQELPPALKAALNKKYSASSKSIKGLPPALQLAMQKNTDFVQGETTPEGTFIPDLGGQYERSDAINPPPDSYSIMSRRKAAMRALGESTKTEQLLRERGIDVPESGRPPEGGLPDYLKVPLKILQQLQRGQFAVIGGIKGILDKDPAAAVNNFYRGLILAEPHETADILERFEYFEEHPVQKFTLGLAGDMVADPLSWMTFGGNVIAKAAVTAGFKVERALEITAKGMRVLGPQIRKASMTVDELRPLLSSKGRKVIKSALDSGMDPDVVAYSIQAQVAAGGEVGRSLIDTGIRIADWVPRIGGTRLNPLGRNLTPGAIVARIEDIDTTKAVMDKLTQAMVGSKGLEWFGKAFVPYWVLKADYPDLIEMERYFKAGDVVGINKIAKRLKPIAENLSDPAQRELLMSLIDDPSKISGHKLVTKIVTVENEVAVTFNTDYWGEGRHIGEHEAVNFVKTVYEAISNMKSAAPNPAEATRRADSLLLGRGAYGEVIGGEKFQELIPFIETIVNLHPDRNLLSFNFGDWVIKIPNIGRNIASIRAPMDPGIIPTAAQDIVNEHNISFFKRLAAEFHAEDTMLRKIGADPFVAEGRLITRKLNELVPGTNAYSGAIDVPILVKRFVKGKTLNDLLDELVVKGIQDVENAGVEALDEILNLWGKTSELLVNIARYGVSPKDFHFENIMFSETTGMAQWIDMGRWIDHNRNITGRQQSTALRSAPLEDLRLVARELALENVASKVEGTIESTEILARLTQAYKKALESSFETPVDGMRQIMDNIFYSASDIIMEETLLSHGIDPSDIGRYISVGEFQRAALEVDESSALVTQVLNDMRSKALRFLQKAKENNLISEYTISGVISDQNLQRQSHLIGGGVFGTHARVIQFINPETHAFQPVTKTVTNLVESSWEEVTEVLVQKHPKIASMTSAEQAKILETHGLARDWITHLEADLLKKSVIDPDKFKDFKKIWGMEDMKAFKDAKTPISMATRLHAIKAGTYNVSLDFKNKVDSVIKDLENTFGMNLSEQDLGQFLLRNALDVAEKTGELDFIDEVIKRYARPLKHVNEERIVKGKRKMVSVPQLDDDFGPLIGGKWGQYYKGLQLPKEIIRHLIQRDQNIFNNVAIKHIFERGHKALAIWKSYATFVNLGFHGRNFVSNLFQLYLKDGVNALNLNRHRHAMTMMSGKEGSLKLANGSEVAYSQVMDWARRYGVYGTGWFGADIRAVGDTTKLNRALHVGGKAKRLLNPVGKDNVLFQMGQAVGGTIENEFRLTGFINDLIRTNNPMFAATNTKKFAFDYSEITEFEQTIAKGIFPFYTWMRKNMELQISQIMKQPGKYTNIERLKSNLERAAPKIDKRWVPKYFPEIYAVQLPEIKVDTPWGEFNTGRTPQGSPIFVNPNLPFQDLNKLFDPQDWISSLGPWKAFIEVVVNRNFFTNREIQKYEGERVPLEVLNALPDPIKNQVANLIGAVNIYQPETESWQWSIHPKLKFLLEQVVFLKNWNQAIGLATGETPFYAKENAPYKLGGMLTGLKAMPYNVTGQLESSIFERRDALRDIKKSAQDRGEISSKFLQVPRTH